MEYTSTVGLPKEVFTSKFVPEVPQLLRQPVVSITTPLTPKPLVLVSDAELRARVQWANVTTPHFSISYDRICYHEKEAVTLAHEFEEAYRAIYSMIREGHPDRLPVYLCDLRSPSLLGRKTTSHFNAGERTIYLVRSSFEPAESELLAMVSHGMRFNRYLKHYGITPGWAMLEDAFATFVSERLTPGKGGFPFYGADPDVIAHHILSRSFLPNLSYAWHSVWFSSELERRTMAGAFLLYLGDTSSDDRVVAFSRSDDDVTSSSFATIFGSPIEQLEEEWKEHIPNTLCLYTDAERLEMIRKWDSMMARRHQ